MSSRSQILENIEKYVSKVESTEYLTINSNIQNHEARLDKTIKDLSERVDKEKAALEELLARSNSSDVLETHPSTVSEQIQQLQILKKAYKDLTPAEPSLPATNSALPALLALRTTSNLISDTRISIESTYLSLKAARDHLRQEKTYLKTADELTTLLEARVANLRETASQSAAETSESRAQKWISAYEDRKTAYDTSTRTTLVSLFGFINGTLAPLLAAEELGGPVVGEDLDVTEETLTAGFTTKHKPRKVNPNAKVGGGEKAQDGRQRRIDEIWGARGGGVEQFEDEEERSESQAAGEEMTALVQELLNVAADREGGRWVTLERDSAAGRFLVRCGMAVLDDKDARKIRLLDFGREMDE